MGPSVLASARALQAALSPKPASDVEARRKAFMCLGREQAVPPPEFKPSIDWAKSCGVSKSAAKARLSELVRLGRAEQKDFMIYMGGRMQRVPHYRIPELE